MKYITDQFSDLSSCTHPHIVPNFLLQSDGISHFRVNYPFIIINLNLLKHSQSICSLNLTVAQLITRYSYWGTQEEINRRKKVTRESVKQINSTVKMKLRWLEKWEKVKEGEWVRKHVRNKWYQGQRSFLCSHVTSHSCCICSEVWGERARCCEKVAVNSKETSGFADGHLMKSFLTPLHWNQQSQISLLISKHIKLIPTSSSHFCCQGCCHMEIEH